MRIELLSRAMAAILTFAPAFAVGCINDYKSNHAVIQQSRGLMSDLVEVQLLEPWVLRENRLRREVAEGGDYKVQNDLASTLMHTGGSSEAIPILQQIEKEHPGLYRTASNLGTAYELAGDPVRALEWIRTGIERNPVSHAGSEWIHVRILEAKVAHLQEPHWRPARSVLGLDFGEGSTPKAPAELPKGNAGAALTLADLESGLKYQLHERLQFVQAPNALVASLLLDYGDVVAASRNNIGVAQDIYDIAKGYARSDAVNPGELEKKIAKRSEMAWKANHPRSLAGPLHTQSWLLLGGSGMLVGIGIYTVCRRSIRKRRAVA